MTHRRPVVAIDGPAGAGKSTVARALAQKLGFILLDTGALYRAVALAARQAGVEWDDEKAVAPIARRLVQTGELRLVAAVPDQSPGPGGSGVRVMLAERDVSKQIRTPEISQGASRISAIATVRRALLDLQRQLGADGGVVVEGRDIGTVVFPDAEAKFFLTASLQARAERRFNELKSRGADVSLEQTADEVQKRDRADEQREVAPLCQAEDAILVDSSNRSVQEVVDQMARLVEARYRSEDATR